MGQGMTPEHGAVGLVRSLEWLGQRLTGGEIHLEAVAAAAEEAVDDQGGTAGSRGVVIAYRFRNSTMSDATSRSVVQNARWKPSFRMCR